MSRHPHNLSHEKTATMVMGYNYPSTLFEALPGESFVIEIANLTRFLPQVAPTMHQVIMTADTYQVPLRQLFEKLGLSWDDFLTGGEDGKTNILIPQIRIPKAGYEPGSLPDFLGYPTNYMDIETNKKVIVGDLELSALPVLVYMHIINENYRDQNFVKKLDYKKYQEFLDGTYEFTDASGEPLGYSLQKDGLFPKAWSRDYFGRALPNTQRGPEASIPLGAKAGLTPAIAPVITGQVSQGVYTGADKSIYSVTVWKDASKQEIAYVKLTDDPNLSAPLFDKPVLFGVIRQNQKIQNGEKLFWSKDSSWGFESYALVTVVGNSVVLKNYCFTSVTDARGDMALSPVTMNSYASYADLSLIQADLAAASAGASIIAFRLAARMQRFGEILQTAGVRAVEFTLAMFGVRIPDERVQRPIFHGSFRLPVVFSEVLQTSASQANSPQGNLAGHGITGGTNRPIHIKVIEHCYIMTIVNIMPRSQFQNITPKHLLRKTRFDLPNPIFQNVGEQAIQQIEIYPQTATPDKVFGYVPRYSELMHIPSTLHGHMKDTFLHWNMARVYNKGEPVLSAKFRYEKPTGRSFSVQDEDQMQITVGYNIRARRVFSANPQPGIHIV